VDCRLQQHTSDSAKRPRNFGSQSQSSCTGDVNCPSGSKFWWISHPPQHKVPRGDKLPPAPLRMKYRRTFHYPLPNTELPTKSNTNRVSCSSSYNTTGTLNVARLAVFFVFLYNVIRHLSEFRWDHKPGLLTFVIVGLSTQRYFHHSYIKYKHASWLKK